MGHICAHNYSSKNIMYLPSVRLNWELLAVVSKLHDSQLNLSLFIYLFSNYFGYSNYSCICIFSRYWPFLQKNIRGIGPKNSGNTVLHVWVNQCAEDIKYYHQKTLCHTLLSSIMRKWNQSIFKSWVEVHDAGLEQNAKREKERKSWRYREGSFIHWFTSLPLTNSSNSQCWAMSNLGARNCTMISPVGSRGPRTGTISCCFPKCRASNSMRNRAAWTLIGALIWDVGSA